MKTIIHGIIILLCLIAFMETLLILTSAKCEPIYVIDKAVPGNGNLLVIAGGYGAGYAVYPVTESDIFHKIGVNKTNYVTFGEPTELSFGFTTINGICKAGR